jgi:hypothetical protein
MWLEASVSAIDVNEFGEPDIVEVVESPDPTPGRPK